MRLLVIFLILAGALAAESFEAVHERDAWPNGKGTLHISADGIRFEAQKPKHSHTWGWEEIQYFDRLSETALEILTYEDQTRYLGRDKSYRYKLTSGTFSDELMARVENWLGRPLTDRVVREGGHAGYRIPVKHLHSLGGCEGTLEFTDSTIQYSTEHAKDARDWTIDRDVASVWSATPYHLELHVYENNRREFSRTRVYKFDLKEKLDPEFYRHLKLHLYELQTD